MGTLLVPAGHERREVIPWLRELVRGRRVLGEYRHEPEIVWLPPSVELGGLTCFPRLLLSGLSPPGARTTYLQVVLGRSSRASTRGQQTMDLTS
jgi:hypothetical protein